MSGDSELPGGAHGFLGPVEAAEGTQAPPEPRPRRRLTSRQKFAVAALLLAGVTALVVRGATQRPEHTANPPPPYPDLISHITYGGQVRAAAGPGSEFELRILARDDGPGPYEITDIRQEYPGLTVSVAGAMPRAVTPEGAVEIDLVYRVTDCRAAPPDAGLPFLDVTLRNTRAIQAVSQILGETYAHDLSGNLHTTCPDSGMRTGTSDPASPDITVR